MTRLLSIGVNETCPRCRCLPVAVGCGRCFFCLDAEMRKFNRGNARYGRGRNESEDAVGRDTYFGVHQADWDSKDDWEP